MLFGSFSQTAALYRVGFHMYGMLVVNLMCRAVVAAKLE